MAMYVGPLERLSLWTAAAHRLRQGRPSEALATHQGFVLTHAQARAAGETAADIRRYVRSGAWTVPRRGVLCVLPALEHAGRPDDRCPAEPHGEAAPVAGAALALVRPDLVVSTASAVAMWGLPLLFRPTRPSGTMRHGNGGGQSDANAHAAALIDDEIGSWFGVPVTLPSRSVVDLARNHGVRSGLVAADAALQAGITTERALRSAVQRTRGWPGVRGARRAVELADARAESPLESLVRLMVVDQGLPTPELQVWLDTDSGRFRVDALWPEQRVVLEIDGLGKYATTGALRAEKLRQEALERAGYRVIRVMWQDLAVPHRTARRIRSALCLGAPSALLVSSDRSRR